MSHAPKGLIVVDLQNAFQPAQKVVDGIHNILGEYDVIIAMRFINMPGSLFESEIDFRRCYKDCPDAEFVIDLKATQIFDHVSYGLVPDQVEKIKAYGIERWDICGCDTHACVLSTCFSLFDVGIKINVLGDLCTSSDGDKMHRNALKIMERCFGTQK